MNMVKITDEMRTAWKKFNTDDEAILALAPLIIAQYEAEKAAAASPEHFEITSMDQKVQFRDGTPARILAVDIPSRLISHACPVVAWHENGNIYRFEKSGRCWGMSELYDLIPIPPAKRIAYVNVYAGSVGTAVYDTRGKADAGSDNSRTGCNRIELQEGVWHD
jgi:hypothetical protein